MYRGVHPLLFNERETVSTLIHGGVALVCADSDTTKGAVVFCVTVMFALGHSAFNALVCFVAHGMTSLICCRNSMSTALTDM